MAQLAGPHLTDWIASSGNGIQLNNSFERNHWEFVQFALYLLFNSSLPHFMSILLFRTLVVATDFPFHFLSLAFHGIFASDTCHRFATFAQMKQATVAASWCSCCSEQNHFDSVQLNGVFGQNKRQSLPGGRYSQFEQTTTIAQLRILAIKWMTLSYFYEQMDERMDIRLADAFLCTILWFVIFEMVGHAKCFTSPDRIHSGPDTHTHTSTWFRWMESTMMMANVKQAGATQRWYVLTPSFSSHSKSNKSTFIDNCLLLLAIL